MDCPATNLPAWMKDQGREPLGPCQDYQADNLQAYPVQVCRHWGGGWICNNGQSCFWRGKGGKVRIGVR